MSMAVGNVRAQSVGGATTYDQIPIGSSRAKNIHYTVPAGKKLSITSVIFTAGSSTSGRPVHFTTKAKYNNFTKTVLDFYMDYSDVFVQDNSFHMELPSPTVFPAGVDLKTTATSPDGAAYSAVIERGWLEIV